MKNKYFESWFSKAVCFLRCKMLKNCVRVESVQKQKTTLNYSVKEVEKYTT